MISNLRSYIIVAKSKKLVEEVETRKKARRIARKKYQEKYTKTKEYIIVSGKTLEEGILSLATLKTKSRSEAKDKKEKTVEKKKTSKQKTKALPKLETLLDKVADEEERKIARINKMNAKKAELF